MRIGDLTAATGVSPRSLRYYEQQGLLVSQRTPGGQRSYAADAVARVQLIQLLFDAGMSSRTIVGILPCAISGTVTEEILARLATERDRLTGRISALLHTRERMDAVIAESKTRLRAQRGAVKV
ncbi:MerR family transcriptional regulator [Lentzea sp. NPDC055074]